jgi:hypothetical protein
MMTVQGDVTVCLDKGTYRLPMSMAYAQENNRIARQGIVRCDR